MILKNQEEQLDIKTQILAFDMFHTRQNINIVASLPGATSENSKVTVAIVDNIMTINFIMEKNTIHRFSRSLSLSDDVDVRNITSNFDQGVLYITMPKLGKNKSEDSGNVTVLTFPESKSEEEKFIHLPKFRSDKPLDWIKNPYISSSKSFSNIDQLFSTDVLDDVRKFHKQIPGYRISPLKNLSNLASMLGLGGIWVKDESDRLKLNSFKVLGGSYAIGKVIQNRLGKADDPLCFSDLTAENTRKKLGEIIFSAATDGNHGKGVAWAASRLGYQSIIYVHKLTSRARIEAIEKNGAKVVVVDGTYDDAVRQVNIDSEKNGWQVISDTSWDGYEDIPRWVMQGYSTMLGETQEQFAAQGLIKPSHVFVQAGVGALAASVIGYYARVFGKDRPRSIVVEPNLAPCLFHSIKIADGKPHTYDGDLNTIMAGLACGDPNPLAWDILRDSTDYFIQCPDYVAAKGMRVYGMPLPEDPLIVSGESGAVTLGALMFLMQWSGAAELREKLELGPTSQILLINSEGDTDPEHFRNVVWEGGEPVHREYRSYWP